MSVSVQKKEDGTYEIKLGNGHAEALKKITDDYNIKSEEQTLGFMLSLLSEAEGKEIKTAKGSFVPSKEITNG